MSFTTIDGTFAIAAPQRHEQQQPMDETMMTSLGGGRPIQANRIWYDFSGGSVAAVAGDDFVVVASDTRMACDGIIIGRHLKKLHRLNERIVLGSWGCLTDVDELRNILDIRMKTYRHNHRKPMSLQSAASMLSNVAYYRRFNPYYSFNILAGIDDQGKGGVYQYDAIGSYERYQYRAEGTGLHYIMPVLDNVIGNQNRMENKPNLSREETIEIIKHAFISAAERDIHTGDSIDIQVITKDGIETSTFALNAH